jgi:SAM-dependent methyltransferase
MEVDPGIPQNHFDLVFSIYGLGWTTDLPNTMRLVSTYLRPGGSFIVSGEHPAYGCLEWNGTDYTVARPYFREGPREHASWKGVPIVIHHRTLATFVGDLVQAGLQIEALVETPVSLGLGGRLKTGNLSTGQNRQLSPVAETSEFYFVASSVRKSVWTLVRQLRGPHLST